MVERNLAKVEVAGSNPVSRSRFFVASPVTGGSARISLRRGGIKTVLIPEENVKDLQEIPDNVKSGLEIVPVKWIDKVLEIALERVPTPLPDDIAVVPTPPATDGDLKAQAIKH